MKVLSLMDFIAAVHELSAVIVLDRMVDQAFVLMGGSEERGGLSIGQLHSAI